MELNRRVPWWLPITDIEQLWLSVRWDAPLVCDVVHEEAFVLREEEDESLVEQSSWAHPHVPLSLLLGMHVRGGSRH